MPTPLPGGVSTWPPVEFRDLSKRFGDVAAVNDLSFDIEAGRVTGFLGPNGAGKSTTLRALLGLVRPSSGSATFGGLRYDELERPAARVGAVLEDAVLPPGRTARNHLRVLAVTGGIRRAASTRSSSAVGLDRRRRPAGEGLLDGDAPAPGDRRRAARRPAGPDPRRADQRPRPARASAWLRGLLRDQADGGRAVLVSSHVLAEVAQSVDDVVVVADGELRAQGTLDAVLGGDDGPATEVRAQDPVRLTSALERRGHRVERDGDVLHVLGRDALRRSARSPATSGWPSSASRRGRARWKTRSSR